MAQFVFSIFSERSLDEVISMMIDGGYIPSFCTGCYRKGRVGADFMDLAKPGLIKEYCKPNAMFTFREYLEEQFLLAIGLQVMPHNILSKQNNLLVIKIVQDQ